MLRFLSQGHERTRRVSKVKKGKSMKIFLLAWQFHDVLHIARRHDGAQTGINVINLCFAVCLNALVVGL